MWIRQRQGIDCYRLFGMHGAPATFSIMPVVMKAASAHSTSFGFRVCILGVLAAAIGVTGSGRRQEGPARQRVKVLARVEIPRGLVAYYNDAVPGIQSSLEIIPGSAHVVNALEHGAAELGYAQADVLYTAWRSGLADDPTPYTNLRAIAVIQRANVFVVVRRDSAYKRISDLGGARIGIDPEGSYGAVYAQVLLKAYGLGDKDVALARLFQGEMATRIKERRLDAAIFVGSVNAASMVDLSRTVGIRILDVDRKTINALRARYPFVNPTAFPAGDITGIANDVHTFGVENVLICRRDLDEELVYQLTAGLFEQAERNAQRNPEARSIDLEQAPATPIPLHAGAARYYRQREILQ
jgi:TRAP transporter TAXI family solute receptor